MHCFVSLLINNIKAKGLGPKTSKIYAIMSKPLLSMDHYLPQSEANDFMRGKKIKHLVVTEFGKSIGILTLRDKVS